MLSCVVGTMEFDDIAMVNIETTAESIGSATVEAVVSSPDDNDETNNTGSASVMILGVADLPLEASSEQESAVFGNEVIVTASVSNNGPDDARRALKGYSAAISATSGKAMLPSASSSC